MERNKLDNEIKKYDVILKVAVGVFLIVILVVNIIAVHQVFVVTKRVDDRSYANQQSLGCVAKFFATPNRANLTVSDLEKCTLARQ